MCEANCNILEQTLLYSLCSSLSSQHQDSPGPSEAPPDCQQSRVSCEREGLTTFTVVPRRCQQNGRCFEVSRVVETSDTDKTERDLNPDALEHPEIHTQQPAEVKTGGNALEKPENLSEIVQHLERENKTWTDSKIEQINNERPVYLKNITKESFQMSLKNLKPVGSKIKNNLRCASQSIDSNIEDGQEYALVETNKEKNWIEEYKERRRKFLGGDDDDDGKRNTDAWGKITREFPNSQMEVDDDHFPSPPPPVCWYENNSDGENTSDQEMDSATDAQTRSRWPNSESRIDQDEALKSNTVYHGYSHLSKPKATNPEPESAENISVPQAPEHPSKSRSDARSLFALAVFQKAKHSSPDRGPKHNKR